MTAPHTTPGRLVDRLDQLHTEYVVSINNAVAAGADDEVRRLAAGYDAAATSLVAEHEDKTHLLPLRHPSNRPASAVRRWLRRAEGTRPAA